MFITRKRACLPIVAATVLGACGFTTPIADAPDAVYFGHNRQSFSETGVATLARLAAHAREQGAGEVLATGYADTVGEADYNLALSMRRAEAVRRDLIARGAAPADAVVAVAQGEERTGDDGVAAPLSRRVAVTLGEAGAVTPPRDDAPFAFPLPDNPPASPAFDPASPAAPPQD